MNRFIKTFYLWLGVATACNLMSFLYVLIRHPDSGGGFALYPIAWLMQLPIVLACSLLHYGINLMLQLLPVRHAHRGQGLAAFVILFLFTTMYSASQVMRFEVNSFLSWDMLWVAASDIRQILPDIGRRFSYQLPLLSLCSALLSLCYVRHYHNTNKVHSGRVFAILIGVFACSATSSYAYAFKSVKDSAWRMRNEVLPTTYLAASLVEDVFLEHMIDEEVLRDMVLPPQISMHDYLQAAPPEQKPNIFFIMLEAIPWDHYPFTGYDRADVTPNLNALAEVSTIFPRTYATANHSSYSQPSIHSSQYPLRTRSLDQFEVVDYPKVMLFDILAAAGYRTAFISAQNEDWLGMKQFIFAHTDLEYFLHSKDELGVNIGIESKIDDKLVCTRAMQYLDRLNPDEPVFMYINLQRTHFPYDIPEDAPRPYQPCSTKEFPFSFFSYDRDYTENVINKFDNALHYVDTQVGIFLDYLKENGLYENSLIVVSADHGEAFYEHGYPTHSTTLYDTQMRVCTLIKQPGQTASTTRSDPISLIDINPSILELLGMANHPNFQGQQILNRPRNGPVYILSHGIVKAMGVVDYPWKYFRSETQPPCLFNLESDPAELQDLSGDHPDKVLELRGALERFQQQQMYYYSELSPEERSRLYPPRL